MGSALVAAGAETKGLAVPLGGRQGRRQFFGVQSLDVAGRTGLDAPAFGKPTAIDHVEAELVDQFGHPGLCDRVVPCNHQRSSVSRSERRAVARDLTRVDVVERLHHMGPAYPGL